MPGDGKFHPQSELAPVVRQFHEIITQAQRLLNEPMPDTFLGRKTQEPFPRESEEAS